MKCPKCHFVNLSDSKFCKECGTQLIPPEDVSAPTETLETPKEELTRGTTFANRYEIIEELGKGGMGKVYRVEDKKTKEELALKLIKPEIASDKKTLERFSNELKLAHKISHKNVCRMYHLGEEKGTHFITMEYVPGEDLKSSIRRMGPLTTGKTLFITKQVCEGLAEAHRLGVVHRDLKPQNIMIDKEGNARIMDFGIARSIKEKGITGAGVMIGTPEYMSPEQVEGKEVDQRSDIYSLGVILYEMVTGRVPFEGETPLSVAVKQKTETPEDPRELNSQIPEDLSHVILRCMEKDKEKRYQSAGEVRAELENLEKGIPAAEKVIPKRKPITSKEITVKFTPKKLLIPAAVIVVLVAVGLFLLLRPKGPVLDPERIVVAPFKNKTGEPDYDNVGFMASDSITQGLMQGEMISVSSLPVSDALSNIIEEKDTIRVIARATWAGKVVTGSYYLEGETIKFVSQVHDVRLGKIIGSVESVSGSASELSKTIESLRQKVMGVLAVVLDAEFSAAFFGYVPAYEAYQAFIESWKAYHRYDYAKSIELNYEAIRLDPDFLIPLRTIAAAHMNRGEYAQAEEVIKKLEASRDKLPLRQKIFLEYLQANLRGDRIGEYEANRRLYKLDPAMNSYGFAWSAVRINRPREAIEVFQAADPGSPIYKYWSAFWDFYAYAYHMLGDHKNELKIARKARKLYPDQYNMLWIEMRALAAIGKIKELEILLEESQQLPPKEGWDRNRLLRNVGQELRDHGYVEDSLDFLERAIQELKRRPESEMKTEDYRSQMALLLIWTERWEEAKIISEDLFEENPDSLSYYWYLGLIAARMGDRERAQRIYDKLGKIERPYLYGRIPYYQACISSLLGEKAKAVKLLQEAVDQGMNFGPGDPYHPIFNLEPLADYPPFKEFMKPKG